MSFFSTKEFNDFKRVHTRVQQVGGNTIKNMSVYVDRFAIAIEVAERDYNNVGFFYDGYRPGYKWAESPKLSPGNYTEKDLHPEPVQVQANLF